jgi:hypothetical protein
MVNDMPDSARFFPVVDGLIVSLRQQPKRRGNSITALWCVEKVHLSWGAEGKADAAIRLEQLWDEAGKTLGVAYPLWVRLEQLSRRGRPARFPEHLCGTLSRLFSVRSKTQF